MKQTMINKKVRNITQEEIKKLILKNTFGGIKGKRQPGLKTIVDKTKTGQIRTTIPRTLAEIKKIDKGDILQWGENEKGQITITKNKKR